ncbi:MAG: MYXO-CTERM sorting domain-containing protein [Myxococcales bacterium]|nr:MYXO-CTERM sorting domain-containing protein [Myxococcales bacterium]
MRQLASLLVFVLAATALADWPMARRDSKRTAETAEPANLREPVVTWRKYLGGELGAEQVVALDVEGDGSVEVVLIAGGKLVAKRPDDTVVWETPPLALTSIAQVTDLDGDGARELIVVGESAFVGVIDARTGALKWRLAPGTFGTAVGSVRIADLDADGLDDLYVADNACGSVNGKPRALAWRFRGGFGPAIDDGSRVLWELPPNREYHCGVADVVADLDADGRLEVIAFGIRRAYAYDGLTGAALASGATDPGYDLGFSIPYGVMRTELVGLAGGRRAIAAATNNGYDPSINSRALFVMTWDRARPVAERMKLEWRRDVANLTTDVHSFPARLSADLDLDGQPELVSTFVESGRTTSYVFDALTGVVKARADDVRVVAMQALAPGEAPVLLVSGAAGLTAHRFTAFTSQAFPAPEFTLPAATVLGMVDRRLRRAVNTGVEWATVSMPASTRRALVVVRNQAVEAWSTGAVPAVVHALPLPAGLGLRGVAPHQGVSGAAEGLLIARSDGYLIALNAALQPINFSDGELPQPGIRTGGSYSGPRGLGHSPITARFDGGHDDVLVRDSLGRLLRLDPRAANLITDPLELWSWPGAAFPVAMDVDQNGSRELLVALEGDVLVGRSPMLVEQFRVPGQASWSSAGAPTPMRSDGGWVFGFPQMNASTGEGRAVVAGPAGMVWLGPSIVTAGSGQGYTTVDDFDGDGDDDLIASLRGSLHLYRGSDGVTLGTAAPTYSVMPVTVRGRAGPITTVAAGSYHELQGLSLARPVAATTAASWSVSLPQRFYNALAATLSCPSGLVIANTGFQSPHLVVVDVQTGLERARVLLSRGRRFGSDGELADAGVLAGSLGNVTALQTLWPGQSAVLIGSTDGFLYAVDACAAGAPLLWALDLRAPVGEPVTGDLDGDGQQELVLTAADGFLYGIGPQRFPSPAGVRDVDPTQPDAGDVDESNTPGSLSVEWDAVPGATGYEWALLTAGGTPVSRHPTVPGNPFVPVAAGVTSATAVAMLRDNARYVFAVRANGPAGASSERLSDGVRYRPREPPDAGQLADAGVVVDAGILPADAGTNGPGSIKSTSGCGCSAPGGSLLSWLVLVGGAAMRRRRVRPVFGAPTAAS